MPSFTSGIGNSSTVLRCAALDGTIHMRFLSLVSKIAAVFVYLDPIIPNSDDMA